MPLQKITILFSDGKSNENKLSKYFSDENILWTYLGPNYINFKRIDSSLREHFRYIEISERLDKISDRIRDQYQLYVDDLNNTNKDTFEWWFTTISSRNPSMSGVFQNICYLELIKEILPETSKGKKLVIVAENYSIGHAIEANADALGVEVITIGKNKKSLTCRIASGIWWTGKCLFKTGLNYIYARLSAIRVEKKPTQRYSGISGKTCMIDVFVYAKNFSDDGGFVDRYFPGLESFLIKNGYNVVYYPTFAETKLNKYSLYCKARANDRVFLIEQDFLKIKDYFKSFIHALKSTTLCVNAPPFRGFDVAKIDYGDFKWDCFETIFKAYLQYYAFLRMSVSLGDKFERIILWHENQLQDKALCKAVHENFKACKIVGSHGYIHFLEILNLYPLNSEAKSNFVPDTIIAPGDVTNKEISNYLSRVPVYTGAPLRYGYLYDISQNLSDLSSHYMDILLLLPYWEDSAIELICRSYPVLSNIYPQIYVRTHPASSLDNIISNLPEYIDKTRLIFRNDCSLNNLLKNKYIVISSCSGSILEAIANKLPTVTLANMNTITFNLFPKYHMNASNVLKCYDDNSLYLALQSINSSKYQPNTNIFKKFICPVNDDTIGIYLE